MNIRDRLHRAIFEKGIQRPIQNLTNMIGGGGKHLTTYNGNLYDEDDPDSRLVMTTRMEMEELKAQARQKRSFRD